MDFEKFTKYLDSLESRGIPSTDCMIYEDHKLLYRHMNGTVDAAGQKKMSGNELYLMFSMTKVQTMTAVMQLVEQGKISLEDPVAKFLPAYGELTVLVNREVQKLEQPLLIKHLLSMQSGLDYDLNRPGILRVLKERGQSASTREIVDAFTESPLKFIPGEHFEYSLSHDVIAAIVEVVAGMRFSEYLKKNVWEPLSMSRTFFAKPMNEGVENLVAQFIWNEPEKPELMPPSCNYQLSENYESGGAGLISCTEDYAVFVDTLACGGISAQGVRILRAETIELMKQNLLCPASRRDIEMTMGRRGYGYGCGVQVLMEPQLLGSCAPAGVFGWDGAAGSCIIMDTQSKRSLVYTQHVRNCGTSYAEFHPMLRELLFT